MLSGFGLTGNGFERSIFVSYGPSGDKLSFVEISLRKFNKVQKCCGMNYGMCDLRVDVEFKDEKKIEVEGMMDHYCVLVPFTGRDYSETGRYYAIVYDDWTIESSDGEMGRKLPQLCQQIFSLNVSGH